MEKLYSSGIASALARRTVHIKMQPTARTFSERREVLRVLQNFGDVTMFRSYKYHSKNPVPNAFLSIFKDESAAQAALNASPMRYRLITGEVPGMTDKSDKLNVPNGPPSVQAPEDEKVFELSISTSQFDHQHYIENEPMFGPWKPMDRKHSFFGGGLELPHSLMSSGLRDWEMNSSKWRSARDDIEGAGTPLEGLGVRNRGPDGSAKDGINIQWRVEDRRKKRLQVQWKDGPMGGLRRYSDQFFKAKSTKEGGQQPELPKHGTPR